MSSTDRLTASVLRTDLAKLRLVQLLPSICIVIAPLARWTLAPILLAATGALFVGTCAVFFRARRSFGQTILIAEGNRLQLGDAGEIGRTEVSAWTLESGVASLRTPTTLWRLSVPANAADGLRQALAPLFGAPRTLQRRGSARARKTALAVAALGAGLAAAALVWDLLPLVVLGIPALLIGLATFGALSQRVAAN